MNQTPQIAFQHVGENLYRNPSSKVYYVLVKVGGKQIKRSLNTTDRQLANRRKKEAVDKLRAAEGSHLNSNITFDQMAKKWLISITAHLKTSSYNRRVTSVNQLEKHFKGIPLKKISKRQCQQWASLRSKQLSASTFNNELETLSFVFRHGIEHGFVVENPSLIVKRRKVGKTEIIIPSRTQFEQIVKTLKSLDVRYWQAADLVQLLAYSGMRLSEATSLRWKDVDFENGRFTVTGGETGTKNHEVRVVPLFPKLESFLKSLIEETSPDAQAWVSSIKGAKKAMATVCEMHEYPRFNHHSLRHFFCSNAIECGIDFKTIAAWLGHKDGGILVAQTYGHLRDTHSYEMAKLMK